MKRPSVLFALLAAFVVSACSITPDWAGPGRPMAAGEESEEPREGPSDLLLNRALLGSDTTPEEAFAPALAASNQITATTNKWDFELGRIKWNMVGPTNIGGRILDIAVDPVLADTVYVAAASGGVWKSTDAATTFTMAWPHWLPQAIGALAMSPSGVLYAGTGETGPGGGSLTYGGNGIYRSTDRGQTWQHIGLPDSSRISRIVIDPANEDRVFVAASGPLFTPGGQRGIYLSEDGGDTWERVLRGDNETTGGTDVAINPANPNIVYAAMWDHRREPDVRRYNGVGSGLYKSTDGGKTWSRIGLGIFGPAPHIGRIGVAIAPTAPDTVYATVATESGLHAGVYKSTDGGTTWSPRHSPNLAATSGYYVYGWWFGRLWVDPDDPNRVWHAGVSLNRSTDGGTNWSNVGGVHSDQHAMAWDPKVPNRVYLGNDGGTYRSDNDGNQWNKADYEPYTQLYTLDVSEQEPSRMVAGFQDNGVNRSYRADPTGKTTTVGPDQWNEYVGGDGLEARINPANQRIVYGCYQYGECFRSTNDGNSSSQYACGPTATSTNPSCRTNVVSSRKNWLTPIEFDQANPSIVYSGGEILSRSVNDGQSWTAISTDLSNGPGRETNPLFKNYGTITTIWAGPGSNTATGTIYVGTDDGNLWYTHDGAATWTKATDPDLPKAWITRVEGDPSNPNVAYVTYSGFRTGNDDAYILRTTDGGRNWKDMSGALPKAPLNDVNVIDRAVVVASDFGVFLTRDVGKTWLRVGKHLPLAPIHELRFHRPTRTLYAATFGRSVWTFPLGARFTV